MIHFDEEKSAPIDIDANGGRLWLTQLVLFHMLRVLGVDLRVCG